MCKIAMMSGIKPSKVKEAWNLAKELAPFMTANDDDGFGYAAITKDGTLMGERWLDTELAFKYKEENKADKEIQSAIGEALMPLESGYTSFGKPTKDNKGRAVALILHARWATCEKGLKNVHPFVEADTALIHNGVISNHHVLLNKYDPDNTRKSTCDSEALVYSYTKNQISSSPDSIKVLGEETSGYYACGVLTKDSNGTPIMDVFKSASASLYGTFVPQVGCFVYCTSEDILKNAIRNCGFTWQRMFKIKEGNLIRHNAVTGASVIASKFEERSYSSSTYRGAYEGNVTDWNDRTSTQKYNGGSTYYPSNESESGIIDMTPKVTTYKSWEDYQNKKYGKLTEEANDVIVAEINKKKDNLPVALPSENDMPNFIKKLALSKRDTAFDDYIEITERYNDYKHTGRM